MAFHNAKKNCTFDHLYHHVSVLFLLFLMGEKQKKKQYHLSSPCL